MIDARDILADFRSQLARQIAKRDRPPAFEPLTTTVWIASSLLQKAIRRGRCDLALRAAATLLVNAPDRFWRRCGGIAFEDIGVANPEVVGLVAAALGGKRMRASLGGEWSAASFIVDAMALARKCRAADDLLMSAELHPAFTEARKAQAALSIDQLRRIVLSTVPLHERALALWFMAGTDRRSSPHLASRPGEPAFVFDVLDELGVPPTMVTIAREGFRRTGEVLCPFVALLMADALPAASTVEDDQLPPEIMLDAVPGWALDMYTREGKIALHRYLHTDAVGACRIRDGVARGQRVGILGNLLFRAEGGLVMRRLRSPLGDDLRRMVDLECYEMEGIQAAEVLDLLRADIPILNRVRAGVMGVAGNAMGGFDHAR